MRLGQCRSSHGHSHQRPGHSKYDPAKPVQWLCPSREQADVPISSPTNLCIICLTHCSRMMASLASATAALSVKSTPVKVGGTLGFLAKKASDSGVGMMGVQLRQSDV